MKTWIDKITEEEIALGQFQNCREKPEKGFRTQRQWQAIWGCKKTRTNELIALHIKSGRMMMKIYYLPNIIGSFQGQPHYALKK